MPSHITIEQLSLFFAKRIRTDLILEAEVSVERVAESLNREFDVHIRGYLFGEELHAKEIRHPSDWWQAFKQRWFPKWALKRWPVSETVHQIDFHVFYPNFRPKLPNHVHGKRIMISKWTAMQTDPEASDPLNSPRR